MGLIHTADADTKNQTPVGAANPLPITSGGAAVGAAGTGNPQRIGSVYHSSRTAVTDGQAQDASIDVYGSVRTTLWIDSLYGNAAPTVALGGLVDTMSNAQGTYYFGSFNQAYNGTTWDRVRGDTNGIVAQVGLSAGYWSSAAGVAGIVNTTTAVTVKAAAGASVRNYIDSIQLQTATLGGATEIAIRDGAAGTVLWRSQLQTTALPLININFVPPLKGTANTLVEVVTLTAVTGGVYANLQGHTGA